jgi:hypothetical protein
VSRPPVVVSSNGIKAASFQSWVLILIFKYLHGFCCYHKVASSFVEQFDRMTQSILGDRALFAKSTGSCPQIP